MFQHSVEIDIIITQKLGKNQRLSHNIYSWLSHINIYKNQYLFKTEPIKKISKHDIQLFIREIKECQSCGEKYNKEYFSTLIKFLENTLN